MIIKNPLGIRIKNSDTIINSSLSEITFLNIFSDLILKKHKTDTDFSHYQMFGLIYNEYILVSLCFKSNSLLFADIFPQFHSQNFNRDFTPSHVLNEQDTVRKWFKKHISYNRTDCDGSAAYFIAGDGDPLYPPKIRLRFRNF